MANINEYIAYKIANNATLTGLISDRYFPQVAPQTETRPSLVYTVIGTNPVNTKSVGSTLDAIRVQFTIMADSSNTYNGQEKVDQIGEAVRSLFEFIQNDTQASTTIQQTYFNSGSSAFDQSGGQDGTYMNFIDITFYKKR